MQIHAIDEARHSRGYVALLGLVFPNAADAELRVQFASLSPVLTLDSPLAATPGSPYSYAATVDELIQMNIAEIRTRFYHQLQRPALLDTYCPAENRPRVRQFLDWLLLDETRHIAYTARLIEQAAQAPGAGPIIRAPGGAGAAGVVGRGEGHLAHPAHPRHGDGVCRVSGKA